MVPLDTGERDLGEYIDLILLWNQSRPRTMNCRHHQLESADQRGQISLVEIASSAFAAYSGSKTPPRNDELKHA
jgi:hypothetical protein